MVPTSEIGHSVSLSPQLRQVLLLTVSQADSGNATLALADALLRRCRNEDLNDLLKVFEDAQRLSTGNGLTAGQSELNEEFFALRDHWGEGYQISPLLDADEQGLRTHSRAEHVKVGQEFEIDGLAGEGAHAARKQWQRITVSGLGLINGKVAARCVGNARNTANVDLFEPATIVRPHFMPNSNNTGRSFPTPDEHRVETEKWESFDDAITRIEDRVNKTLIGLGKPKLVVYSAYTTDCRGVPVDNLDEFAVQGKVILVAEADRFHGGDESTSYESPVVENPTWLDLCKLANDMIETTCDYHHVFLEDVSVDEEATKNRPDEVKVYRFEMGS